MKSVIDKRKWDDLAIFEDIRSRTTKSPMTEEEVVAEVNAARRNLYVNAR